MLELKVGLGVAVVNDKIYAIGGYLGRYNHSRTNEEYDPETATLTFKAAIPTARTSFAVAVYQNKVYCIGGSSSIEVEYVTYGVNEVYDPATDTWETKASILFFS